MDIMLPDLEGSDAVKALKENYETENIPIIFISGIVSSDQSGVAELNVGGNPYIAISKPFTAEVVINEVNKMLG